ncbi:hypothetical protein U2I54_24075 [Bacillus pseudomycoides]|uniref:Uncharacterized protein n=1 Tax=Bacillus bingmayongensis TaxID=1150157 RepID=A0ABU5K2Z5_9BACI|nr:hypothetical protein [Bacillus pseudomycoides]
MEVDQMHICCEVARPYLPAEQPFALDMKKFRKFYGIIRRMTVMSFIVNAC